MKKYISKILSPLLIFTMSLAMVSCVSMKKHNAVVAENDSLKQRTHDLNREMAEQRAMFEQKEVETNKQLEVAYLKALTRIDSLQILWTNTNAALKERTAALDELYGELYAELSPLYPGEIQIDRNEGRVRILFSDRIFFESGSDKISKNGEKALANFSKIMGHHPEMDIRVIGHTDSVAITNNDFEDNWDLSTERATSVVRVLQDQDIDPERLVAAGKGKFDPAASNKTPESRQLNRRTEILLVPNFSEDIFDFLFTYK